MRALRTQIILIGLAFVLGVFCSQVSANITTYSFDCITTNSAVYGEITGGQLFVDVFEISEGVSFIFRNEGPLASTIAEVYFDDGTLMDIATVINGSGVSFTENSINPVDPANLPGGQELLPPFMATTNFSAEADGNNATGIDPGEWLEIQFTLQGTLGYTDVINSLALPADAPASLRIGIHVRGLEDEESESYVNNGVIPAPGAFLLCSIGTGLVVWLRKGRVF